MADQLVVTRPFLNFVRGDMIVDAAKVMEIMSTEYRRFVTKISMTTMSKG
jgi:hypothetical protein